MRAASHKHASVVVESHPIREIEITCTFNVKRANRALLAALGFERQRACCSFSPALSPVFGLGLAAAHRTLPTMSEQPGSVAPAGLVGQPTPQEGTGASTGTASAQQPAGLAANAKLQMDAVASDKQARGVGARAASGLQASCQSGVAACRDLAWFMPTLQQNRSIYAGHPRGGQQILKEGAPTLKERAQAAAHGAKELLLG